MGHVPAGGYDVDFYRRLQRDGEDSSDGFPYPVFLYAGLLPWFYISGLEPRRDQFGGEAPLISKVYFPRLILPLSATIAPLVDLALAFIAFLGLMAWFGWSRVGAFSCCRYLPVWGHMAFAAGLWVSALYVRYRDVGHILPMFIQLWMFVSHSLSRQQLFQILADDLCAESGRERG